MRYQLAMSVGPTGDDGGNLHAVGETLHKRLPCRHVAPPRYVSSRRRREQFREWAAGKWAARQPKPMPSATVIFTVEVHPSSVALVQDLLGEGILLTACPMGKGGK